MSLFDQWKEQLSGQTSETFDAFWDKYSTGETRIYSALLKTGNPVVQGNLREMAERYEVEPVIFMGFLDGINTSLNTPLSLEDVGEEDHLTLNIDFEKLYFNMLKANAEYLYTLDSWNSILTDEKRQEITKEYKKSKTVVKEKTPGRNDPCPCGSGRKYKKCCGA